MPYVVVVEFLLMTSGNCYQKLFVLRNTGILRGVQLRNKLIVQQFHSFNRHYVSLLMSPLHNVLPN
ncbi:hypothetical protein X798_07506 [Onchocerca flexuosa]|uniref:Uncharacterized protein n=1 Tax=Onchocerca flexuosa TaxID=387005 RepID=A0A238BLH4_9BILA|nr:hypothetical protein X798_07506 [Onchocerca flexuosa]